jgi:hypothetical protein
VPAFDAGAGDEMRLGGQADALEILPPGHDDPVIVDIDIPGEDPGTDRVGGDGESPPAEFSVQVQEDAGHLLVGIDTGGGHGTGPMVLVTLVGEETVAPLHRRGAVHPQSDAGAVKGRLLNNGRHGIRQREKGLLQLRGLIGSVAEEKSAEMHGASFGSSRASLDYSVQLIFISQGRVRNDNHHMELGGASLPGNENSGLCFSIHSGRNLHFLSGLSK